MFVWSGRSPIVTISLEVAIMSNGKKLRKSLKMLDVRQLLALAIQRKVPVVRPATKEALVAALAIVPNVLRPAKI